MRKGGCLLRAADMNLTKLCVWFGGGVEHGAGAGGHG